MDFLGFKINAGNMRNLERVIDDIKETVHRKAQVLYNELLSREIQILADEITLNVYNQPLQRSLYEEGIAILNQKIAVAMAKNLDTEYNFAVALNIFTNDKDVYAEFASYNHELFEEVLKIKNVIDQSVTGMTEPEIAEQRLKLWDSIIKRYINSSCLIIKIFPLKDKTFSQPLFKDLHFDSVESRADLLGRQRITNKYLSAYAGAGDIPPHKLMEYLDQALMKLSDASVKKQLADYVDTLKQSLRDLTEAIVMQDPNKRAPAAMGDTFIPDSELVDVSEGEIVDVSEVTEVTEDEE